MRVYAARAHRPLLFLIGYATPPHHPPTPPLACPWLSDPAESVLNWSASAMVVLLQAGAAPASTPMVVVQGADLQAATAAVSTPVDMVRAQLADRGVNSSTHGHVANDADIAEELKALWAGTSAAWSAG